MKLDKAERSFLENYNAEMMEAIDEVSQNIGLNANGYTLHGFNVTEAFDKFAQYIEGYADYKLQNTDNPEASTDAQIAESVKMFIESAIFEDRELAYCELPGFVSGYLTGVRKLTEAVNRAKDALDDEGMVEASGNINTFCDQFMEKVDARFQPAMEKIVEASGYNSRKWLEGHLKGTRPKTEKVQFV